MVLFGPVTLFYINECFACISYSTGGVQKRWVTFPGSGDTEDVSCRGGCWETSLGTLQEQQVL